MCIKQLLIGLAMAVVLSSCSAAPEASTTNVSSTSPATTVATAVPPTSAAAIKPAQSPATPAPTLPAVGLLAATIRVDQNPFHLAAGHGAVWVPNTGAGTLSRIDPRTNQVVATIPIGDPSKADQFGATTSVAVNDDGVWATKNDTQEVVAIDPQTNTVVATIALQMTPHYLAAGDGVLWVTSREDRGAETEPGCCNVVRIDTRAREIVATIPNIPTPGGVAVTDEAVWVVNHRKDMISRIEPQTNQVITTISLGGPGPHPLCSLCAGFITANDHGVWVTSIDGVIHIDPETNKATSRVPIETGAFGITSDERGIWAATYDARRVTQIDPDTKKIIATSILPAELNAIVLMDNALWISSVSSHQVFRLDLQP